jgi:nucleotide-binding universal stress UspA family protein
MYKKIIVPVDAAHPDPAPTMLEAARKVSDPDSVITLLSVVEALPAYITAQVPGNYEHEAKAFARQELERIAKEATVPTEIDIRVGRASQVILDVAREKGADAIVIASHRPDLSDYFLGSTAARVVRSAKCTVLVIR